MHMEHQSMLIHTSITTKDVTSCDTLEPNESHCCLSKRCDKNVSHVVSQ
jgi:hypothetical protein